MCTSDEALAVRIAALEARMDELTAKAEIAEAAALHWQPKMALPEAVVFGNSCGEVATLPLEFIQIVAANHQYEATSVTRAGDEILVKDGEEVIVKMPTTLWVCLERVLSDCPFLEEEY